MEHYKVKIIDQMHLWLRGFIIAHNICPFAKLPYQAGLIRIGLFEGEEFEEMMLFMQDEIDILAKSSESEISNTIAVLSAAPVEFEDFLDFRASVHELLTDMNLNESFQLIAFHPGFRFKGTTPSARINWVNKSPYAALHILRQSEVDRAVQSENDGEIISKRNEEKLNSLNQVQWERVIQLTSSH